MVEINPPLKGCRISHAALAAWVFSLVRVRNGVMQYWDSLFGAQRMTPAIARQVVALGFSCGPVLGAVSVALPSIILNISAAGTCIFTSLLSWLCANHDVS